VAAQDIPNDAVGTLSLTIRLRVIRGGHPQRGAKTLKEHPPKPTGEARISIGNDRDRQTMVSEDMGKEQLGCFGARDLLRDSRGVDHLAKTVDKHNNTSVAMFVGWVAKHKVQTD
jgi:hypothetical protein